MIVTCENCGEQHKSQIYEFCPYCGTEDYPLENVLEAPDNVVPGTDNVA